MILLLPTNAASAHVVVAVYMYIHTRTIPPRVHSERADLEIGNETVR